MTAVLGNIALPRLPANQQIVGANGNPTIVFSLWWQQIAGQIETSINGVNAALVAAGLAQSDATAAGESAATAQTMADTAQDAAAAAQATANDAVPKNAGDAWAAPTGTEARTAYAAYVSATISDPPTQAEVQVMSDGLQAVSQHLVALIADLRGNGALTS